MKNSLGFVGLVLCLSFFLFAVAACGDSENEHENNHAHHNHHNHHNNGGHVSEIVHPLGEAISDEGHFKVVAVHDPETPRTGAGNMTLTVSGAEDDAPLAGLKITLTPWMPGHGHGSNKTPVVTEKTNAIAYEISDIVYTMPGEWEARITIESAEHRDTIAFGYNVQ